MFLVKAFKISPGKNKTYGFFNQITAAMSKKYEGISLCESALKLEPKSTKAIISHEHIHFRQFLDSVYRKENKRKGMIVNGNHLFDDKNELYEKLKNYWFSEAEVEARLHELVIFYYRKHHKLPLSIEEFVKVVFFSSCVQNSEFSGHDRPSLKKWIRKNKKEGRMCNFRSIEICVEIMMMCESIKSQEAAIKYVYEVLPIFYSRLLRYYGDIDASQMISENIIRPNFYDQIYL